MYVYMEVLLLVLYKLLKLAENITPIVTATRSAVYLMKAQNYYYIIIILLLLLWICMAIVIYLLFINNY